MKKYIKLIIVLLILLAVGGFFVFTKQSNLKTYTNTDSSFSFKYPSSWGEPRVFKNEDNTEFQVDFGDYAFSVNNGYYFSDVNGKRPTVPQLVQAYQEDMNNKNEVKDFQTKDIEVDHHPAVEVSVDDLVGSHYTDVYIYIDQQNLDKFVLVSANRNFVDDETFSKILSSFTFTK